MKRLTHERNNGIKSGYRSPDRKEDLVQRLAEYEGTGLTPEEIVEYTGWRFTSQELPLTPTEDQIENCENEYIVQIAGASCATTLYYGGEDTWYDDGGNYYRVAAWMPLPRTPERNKL